MSPRTHRWLVSLALALLAAACGKHEAAPAAPAPGAAPTPAKHDYESLVSAAAGYVERGRPERGAELAAQAARQEPTRPEAFAVWGRALASQNELVQAAQKYEEARRLGSTDRRVFVELSSVYDVAQQYEKAIEVYRAWLALHDDDDEMHQELGLTLLLRERFDEAATALARAAALRPDDPQVRQDLGYALLRAQRYDDAARELTTVLRADGTRAEAMRLLAQVRAAQGDTNEALKLLDKAVAQDPADERALRVRARLRQITGDAAGALSDYAQLLRKNGNDGSLLLGAAGALLTLDRPAEAEPLLARAKAILGDIGEVRFREAQAAWRKGDKSAVATLRKLADDQPNALEIWRDLDAAAKRFGDKKLAAEARARLGAER